MLMAYEMTARNGRAASAAKTDHYAPQGHHSGIGKPGTVLKCRTETFGGLAAASRPVIVPWSIRVAVAAGSRVPEQVPPMVRGPRSNECDVAAATVADLDEGV